MKRMTLVLLFGLTGCAITPDLPNLIPPKPPHTTYAQEEVHSSIPVMLIDSQGTRWAAAKTEQHIITKFNEDIPPKGALSRIGSFFGGLGFWIILALIVAFCIAPGGTMLWLWKEKNRFQAAFTETVTAIKASKAVDNQPALHDALKNNLSEDSKTLVGKIKATL